jgi:hypothetical protein
MNSLLEMYALGLITQDTLLQAEKAAPVPDADRVALALIADDDESFAAQGILLATPDDIEGRTDYDIDNRIAEAGASCTAEMVRTAYRRITHARLMEGAR